MSDVVLKINSFEGSLDLLLHLINKNKMNIFDVDIIVIIDQYLAYINDITNRHFDISGDFIVMASRLVYIKSLALLPKNEEIKELKEELIGELTEYIICKKVALKLKSQSDGFDRFVKKPIDIDIDKTYNGNENIKELAKSYISVLGKQDIKNIVHNDDFNPYVKVPYFSVYSGVVCVLKNIRLKNCVKITSMFEKGNASKNIAIFLAVLELVRNNRIHVDDDLNCMKVKGF